MPACTKCISSLPPHVTTLARAPFSPSQRLCPIVVVCGAQVWWASTTSKQTIMSTSSFRYNLLLKLQSVWACAKGGRCVANASAFYARAGIVLHVCGCKEGWGGGLFPPWVSSDIVAFFFSSFSRFMPLSIASTRVQTLNRVAPFRDFFLNTNNTRRIRDRLVQTSTYPCANTTTTSILAASVRSCYHGSANSSLL